MRSDGYNMETCNTRKKKKASSIVYFYKSVQHAITNSVFAYGLSKKKQMMQPVFKRMEDIVERLFE